MKRPVFATVINLLLVVFGLVALLSITVREYPDIDPPVVSVVTRYAGASAGVVETQITQIVEDQIAGIEGVRSISSSSRDGRSNITIEFNLGRDVDAAANDVRDRVSRVLNNLPDEADPPEVTKADADASPILWMVLSSDRMTPLELTDYADRYLVDRFASLDGVSSVRLGGERRPAMRIWLDRRKLAARGLTSDDIEAALRSQNIELPAGRIESAEREFTLRTARLFQNAEEFRQMVVARMPDGFPVRLGDVARVEVAPEDERTDFRANGVPAVGLGVIKQSKANTLTVAQAAKAQMAVVAKGLPEGMTIRVNSDFSLFIEASLRAVLQTLLEAGLIVIAVIFIFLGSLRATLIPAVTVPISLLASFIFLSALGFSVNILTLLALVLAIGLVVDDAIVVVENIHRRIEIGEPPLLAAYRGTREVGFAVIATTAVLIAVFAPIALLGGNVGRLFREFALALAAAVACSSIVALTLSPVMAALFLKPHGHRPATGLIERFSLWLDRVSASYRRRLTTLVERRGLAIALVLGLLAGSYGLLQLLPQEVTPSEDRSQFSVQVTAPEGASFEYTQRYLGQIDAELKQRLDQGEIARTILRQPGFGGADEVNTGTMVVSTTDWKARERSTAEIAAEFGQFLGGLSGVRAIATQRGSFGGGFGQPLQVVIGGGSYEELAQWRDRLIARLQRENPRILRLDSDYKETKPTIEIGIDANRAGDLGVPVQEIGRTLETLMGGRRVTTYIDRGEEYDVMLQAARDERASPSDISDIYVRSSLGNDLIPLSNVVSLRETAGAASYNRYDRLRAITISGSLAPGYTLGEALADVERVAREELPATARLSYKGESRELRDSSAALYLTFVLALAVVFLVLAAQFENWIHPLVIMTTVPLALFGALLALWLSGNTLNIYSQIGIVMLIGLAAKNGILIVEFANQRRDAGLPFTEALVEASQVRLRPILMTSIATCAGVVPLMLADGASSEARRVLGVVIFFGVAFSTLLTLFVVPALYQLMCRRTGSPGQRAAELQSAEQGHPLPGGPAA
ncbi:MAG TPA: efflux RND transporter permease subunit [Solimonas sp.]|nr:efflux RND transporter permease subunit [Solimonas sp.]